jgi:cell wall assembly regulator SMI1
LTRQPHQRPASTPSYVYRQPTASPHPPGTLCPTGHPPAPARDRTAAARVYRAWDRIERWLRAHAPATFATLNPPASTRRIRATEAAMSVAFPSDLVASLQRHDGARTGDLSTVFELPPFYALMSLRDLHRDWRTRCGIIERAGEEPGRWWHAEFVPFAQDFAGDVLVVDQRPAGSGRVGLHSHEGGMLFERQPNSLATLLEETARALETGKPYEGYRLHVTDAGALDWTPA